MMHRLAYLAGWLLAGAAGSLSCAAVAHDAGTARYLANEGVLVERGNTKILFDAFYAESFAGQYALVADSSEAAMMKGEAPFDGVDAVFVSHIHPDHFNSRKMIAYLRAQPSVRLYAGIDVIGAIYAADVGVDDPLTKRLVPIHVAPGEKPKTFTVHGLEIEAFAIPHSGDGPIPHYAFRVSLDRAVTVMHLGDADDDEAHYLPYQGDLDSKRTDMAFVPYWLFGSESGRRVIERRIRARAAVGIHADSRFQENPDKARGEIGGDAFIEPGETRVIAAPQP